MASTDDSPLLDDIPLVAGTDGAALLRVAVTGNAASHAFLLKVMAAGHAALLMILATGDVAPSAGRKTANQWVDLAGGISHGMKEDRFMVDVGIV